MSADGAVLEAVLFDMDGTLVDSEKIWTVGLEELARHHGGTLSDAARWAMVGMSMAESMRLLHSDIGQPWRDPLTSAQWLERRVKELYSSQLEWRPGARQLLDEVRAAGLPTALVTATARHLVEVALGTIGAHRFDAVVTADEVMEAKPHPMPYLTAARLLGADPTRCVAVEDSPSGVRSAAAAGCVVLAVPCEVEVPAMDGVRVHPSLAGVDLPMLRALLAMSEAGTRPGGAAPDPSADRRRSRRVG